MASYYFDCETSSDNRDHPDPKLDKIISISFQEIDQENGNPIGKLQILKSWKTSEEQILLEFLKMTGWLENPPKKWKFIPIGCNLSFDLSIIYYRTKSILEYDLNLDFLFNQLPKIDIQPILVIANRGEFKGASLDKFSDKSSDGALAHKLILEENWNGLLNYIKKEVKAFLKLYQQLLDKISTILPKVN